MGWFVCGDQRWGEAVALYCQALIKALAWKEIRHGLEPGIFRIGFRRFSNI
jgi:hypothetical protein